MIVSDPDDLREIFKGSTVEIRQNGEIPAIDSVQALHKRVGVAASCAVVVLDAWAHADGGYVAVVRQTTRIREHVPRLLSTGTGYTSDPSKAARIGREPEPEAVPADWEDPGADLRRRQQMTLNDATRERLSFGEQLDALLAEARSIDTERFRREIRQLEHARQALERRIQRERAQAA